jgi:hypothetical protein
MTVIVFFQYVCKDDQLDELERLKVKRTSDPKCEALQEISQIIIFKDLKGIL